MVGRKTLSSDICKLAYVYGLRWTVKKLKEEIFNAKVNDIRGEIQCIFKKLTLAFHQVQRFMIVCQRNLPVILKLLKVTMPNVR